MPSLMIRLEYPPPGEQLVIRGFQISHGDLGWHEDVGPTKELPRDLPLVTAKGAERSLEDLARAALLSTAGPPMLPTEVGRQLWRLISEGPVGAWWADEVKAAGGAPVRTILDVRPPELRELPWELMTPDKGGPLFRDAKHPWVRATPPWPPMDELPVPVRMLVVVGEPDAADLDVEHELDAIHRSVSEKPGSWHIEVLWGPSPTMLNQRYADVDPHILHVIAHADLQGDGQYFLRMASGKDRFWGLSVEDVVDLPTPAPRLVVLNCCRTSLAGAAAEPAWTFSDAFVELGAAAVVTMQGDIPSSASIVFTSEFYRRLVSGEAVDAAAAQARLQVFLAMKEKEKQNSRSWAMPSLRVATDPDRVLPVRECLSPAELNVQPFVGAFGEVSVYLDRSTERRQLLRRLDADLGLEDSRLLVVRGEHEYGRSAVVRSTLLTLRLNGRNAVYVNLDKVRGNGPKLSWLTVLRQIRHAIWEWVPGIPTEPRERFNHELGFLLDEKDPPAWTPTTIVDDHGREFPSEGEKYREWIAKILLAFRRMLVAAAQEHPLLLALDSLNAITDEDVRDVLAEQLLRPLITGLSSDANVRCVITASAGELSLLPDDVRLRLEKAPIQIGPFDRKDIPQLIGEYVARRGLNPPDGWRVDVESLLGRAKDDQLRPGNLRRTLTFFESLIP